MMITIAEPTDLDTDNGLLRNQCVLRNVATNRVDFISQPLVRRASRAGSRPLILVAVSPE